MANSPSPTSWHKFKYNYEEEESFIVFIQKGRSNSNDREYKLNSKGKSGRDWGVDMYVVKRGAT
jgi:hypothetical protein